jgi:hypothetical protein
VSADGSSGQTMSELVRPAAGCLLCLHYHIAEQKLSAITQQIKSVFIIFGQSKLTVVAFNYHAFNSREE